MSAPDDLVRARRLGLRPAAPGDRPFYVRIHSDLVSGRRFLSPLRILAAAFGSAHQAAMSADR